MKALLFLLGAASSVRASFWMEDIAHQGKASFNPDTSYQVFRNVKDFGAKGDGVTDDTLAINNAISSGNRCGGSSPCVGSTTTPAVVYFPSGTYKISNSIIDYYYTQIIGDPNDMPVIKGTANFPTNGTLGLLDGNPYTATGLRYQSTNIFFRQIRNLVFDTTDIPGVTCGVHWPSSQATSIQNCVFKLSSRASDTHTGIYMEEGSGGLATDLVFYGGRYGAQFGNQQYTMRNLTFVGSHVGIQQLWNWGWMYKSLNFIDCEVGINMSSTTVGSVTLLDSKFANVGTALVTGRDPGSTTGQGSLIIEGVEFVNVATVLRGPGGEVILYGNSTSGLHEPGYIMGNVYAPYGPNNFNGRDPNYFPRPLALLNGDKFYERSKPQYGDVPVSKFISARTFGAKGDGYTDDTAALNALFKTVAANYTSGAIAFVDAGYYMVSDTVHVPPNVRIVGEALASVILGAGTRFADINSPYPVVEVGAPGSRGYVEMSDLIVSTQGGTAGAVLIEYNINTPTGTVCEVGSPPSGLWDVHIRVGGFTGSNLQAAQCPKTPGVTTTSPNPRCIAGYLSMHVTRDAGNLYVENSWVWVADHDIDDLAEVQISIFAGRGLLIDSLAGRIWLVASSVEHHVLYQYQLVGTRDVWMGQIQTETPYFQPNPPGPYPFVTRDVIRHDPDFASDCQTVRHNKDDTSGTNGTTASGVLGLPGNPPCFMAWGLRVLRSRDVVILGAGLYSFFNNYNSNCSSPDKGSNCQARIFWAGLTLPADDDEDSGASSSLMSLAVYNLDTVGSVSAVTRLGNDVALYSDGIATFASTVALFRF